LWLNPEKSVRREETVMKRMLWVALAVLLVPVVVVAQPVLKFDDPTAPGGTVSYAGAGGPILGTDIQFQSILGIGTPANPGVELTCVGCLLNFTTGAVTSEGSPGLAPWVAGAGGTISIVGAIPALGIPAGTTLLTGTFSGTPLEAIGAGLQFGLFAGAGSDVKNEDLAEFFGLPPDFTFANTAITADITHNPLTAAFSGTVVNADLNNTSTLVVVPYPFTLLLVGAGLLGMGLRRRVA
jgi:hypothetical protein